MKILYRQDEQNPYGNHDFSYGDYQVKNCIMEQITSKKDLRYAMKKSHSHTCFEVHIICEGCQIYQVGERTFEISPQRILLIPPSQKHHILQTVYPLCKYAFTFSVISPSGKPLDCKSTDCFFGDLSPTVAENLQYITALSGQSTHTSDFLIANRVYESVVLMLAECNVIGELSVGKHIKDPTDTRIERAKQYVSDNICEQISVDDLASYCRIGKKQLTRLFLDFEETPPAAYIRAQKIAYIERQLADTNRTLKEISEEMNFSSEYVFNAFFKKHHGMPPGKYRRML